MTNSDGSLFDSGTFYITEDTTTSLTMNSLTTSCFNELNARIAEIRDIPPSHQQPRIRYQHEGANQDTHDLYKQQMMDLGRQRTHTCVRSLPIEGHVEEP